MLRIADGVVAHKLWEARCSPQMSRRVCVLLGGTSQTMVSQLGQATALSSDRSVLQYETRGQGRTTDLPLDDCSLQQQVEDFEMIVRAAGIHSPVDLVGFSFGGRLALAVAADKPELVNRCVVTGVGKERTALGRAIIKSWSASLRQDALEAFVWQSLCDGHASWFLERNETKLDRWVKHAVAANSPKAILSLVEQTHYEDLEHPFHSANLAIRAARNQAQVLFLGGSCDRLCPPDQVELLSNIGGWDSHIIPNGGHSVLIEHPSEWTKRVKAFLDST
mmetsp:Transcript_16739/g.27138  ORF Transcript_16739/g.27138 Transcript_16739/m.27138 type:complete len:278 (-) Transcript_16739:649-1482(-)